MVMTHPEPPLFPRESKTLSIVIPVYNERQTLPRLLERVESVSLPAGIAREIVVIDDGSTDGSRDELERLTRKYKVVFHPRNLGKGAAIRRGFQEATGDYVIIQDADLELDPKDYGALLEPVLRGTHDVVFGNRFHRQNGASPRYVMNSLGVRVISFVASFLSGVRLHDTYVGYKLFRKDVLEQIGPKLRSNRFAIEAELTARVARFRVCEVPVAYMPRAYEQGKKIRWMDGIHGLFATVYYTVIRRD
jgi:glycosyltransferase involved in cell wall biosynthesis